MPRQIGNNGRIKNGQILVSMDGKDWTEAATITNWADTPEAKMVVFDESIKAKYVKLVATENYGDGRDFITAAMINLFEDITKEESEMPVPDEEEEPEEMPDEPIIPDEEEPKPEEKPDEIPTPDKEQKPEKIPTLDEGEKTEKEVKTENTPDEISISDEEKKGEEILEEASLDEEQIPDEILEETLIQDQVEILHAKEPDITVEETLPKTGLNTSILMIFGVGFLVVIVYLKTRTDRYKNSKN